MMERMSAAPAPRLVVVDPQHDIARIVRGALALLARQYVLVEVPGAADALYEVERAPVDLLVSAFSLGDGVDGVELAVEIARMSLATPVIVLAQQGDPPPDRARLAQAPFRYFVRPVAEPFLRALRVALDGLPPDSKAGPDLAEVTLPAGVPPVDLKTLRAIMLSLMRDVGAMGVILADRLGRVLIDEGATGYLDRERLAALLAPSFSRTGEMSALVGGRAWAMQYYDGERIDLYALSLGLHYFLCLLFEGSNRAAMGAVAVYGRRAAEQMIDRIGAPAYTLPEAGQGALPAESPHTREGESFVLRQPSNGAGDAAMLEALPETAFDPDALFTQPVDEQLADSLFDPEALGRMAAAFGPDEASRVDIDAARDLGLLGD
jgi:hypothetical protein